MQAHYLALQGVGKLLETISLLTRGERAINPDLTVAGVVVCMHDHQAAHTREVVEDLESFFAEAREMPGLPWSDARVYRPAIRRNIKLAECPSFGQTIFQYAPDANGAKDYAALAETVFGAHAHSGDATPDNAPDAVAEAGSRPEPDTVSNGVADADPAPASAAAPVPEAEPVPEVRVVTDAPPAPADHAPAHDHSGAA
jgi:predicted  nucleic acid-binding Zn-ribbon protein